MYFKGVPIGKCALVRCPENTVCVENKKGEASCVCAPGYAGKPCKLGLFKKNDIHK